MADDKNPDIKHPENYSTTDLRCPDCVATLAIPVIVLGLERGDDGKRVLSFQVHDQVFEPYIKRHMELSDHPKLAEALGDDWLDDTSEAGVGGGPGVQGRTKTAKETASPKP